MEEAEGEDVDLLFEKLGSGIVDLVGVETIDLDIEALLPEVTTDEGGPRSISSASISISLISCVLSPLLKALLYLLCISAPDNLTLLKPISSALNISTPTFPPRFDNELLLCLNPLDFIVELEREPNNLTPVKGT